MRNRSMVDWYWRLKRDSAWLRNVAQRSPVKWFVTVKHFFDSTPLGYLSYDSSETTSTRQHILSTRVTRTSKAAQHTSHDQIFIRWWKVLIGFHSLVFCSSVEKLIENAQVGFTIKWSIENSRKSSAFRLNPVKKLTYKNCDEKIDFSEILKKDRNEPQRCLV